jgi:hypothetical protein
MIAKGSQRAFAALAVWTLALVTVLGACMRPSPTPDILSPVPEPSSTPTILPGFLSYVFPEPDSLVAKSHFSFVLLWALVELEQAIDTDQFLDPEELQEHIEFSIDSEQVNVEIRPSLESAFRFGIYGQVDISPGEHEATIRVRDLSDEILEYSWVFTVVDGDPTMMGLPEGMRFVRPLPDSVVTQLAYQEEDLVPRYYEPGPLDLRGSVCFGVLPDKLVGPGEFLDLAETRSRYYFIELDGIPPNSNAVIRGSTVEPLVVPVFNEEGDVIGSYIGPHQTKCWWIDLEPGEHEATVQVEMASGEVIDYTWRFTITNSSSAPQ